MSDPREFDYVIVGAGPAGCVLAHRLSEDASLSVALIEAGPDRAHPYISMPKGVGKIWQNPRYTWPFPTQPEAATGNKSEAWTRGKVLGGSSAINGMVYVRGQPADFDAIAALSSDDWNWPHIAAAYRALESHALGADATRGDRGPLKLTMPVMRTRLTEAVIAAGETIGLPRKADVNEPDDREAIGYVPWTIYRGRRQSAATAFIEPIRKRRNLSIIAEASAERVCFEQRRAVAVDVRRAGGVERYRARREIILCAGALASPAILQRSGIGPAPLLRALGIEPLHDAPEVGRKLIEHRAALMQWKLREPLSQNPRFAGWRLAATAAQYLLTRGGPMAAAVYDILVSMKSRPELPRPDLHLLIAPFSVDRDSNRTRLEPFHGIHLVGYPLRPASHGEIAIASRDAEAAPLIRPNFGSDARDRRAIIEVIRAARRLFAASPLRELIDCETCPGPDCATDEQILDYYDRDGSCGYHAVGSCRMGRDAASVVDPQLRVRGVSALRVMDTSVMPQIPSGNTNGPTMAMAWRAADIIRATAAGA